MAKEIEEDAEEQRRELEHQQQEQANRDQSKNFAGPLDAIVEGDSDEHEGGDSEEAYGALADVQLEDGAAARSPAGSGKSSSLLGLAGKIGKIGKKSGGKRITVHKESKTQYFEDGSWQEIVLSLSWGHVYDGIKQTRCKPWDDRELDILDGFKTISFWMACMCVSIFLLFETNV